MHYALSFVARKSLRLRRVISGSPVIVIDPNGINYQNLKKLNMNMNDLIEAIRGCDYFSFKEIKYAIFETNGKLCVIPYEDGAQPKNSDLQIKAEPAALPMALLVDGKFLKENLKLADMTEVELIKVLHKHGENRVHDLIIVTIDNNGRLYIQPKRNKFKEGQFNLSANASW